MDRYQQESNRCSECSTSLYGSGLFGSVRGAGSIEWIAAGATLIVLAGAVGKMMVTQSERGTDSLGVALVAALGGGGTDGGDAKEPTQQQGSLPTQPEIQNAALPRDEGGFVREGGELVFVDADGTKRATQMDDQGRIFVDGPNGWTLTEVPPLSEVTQVRCGEGPGLKRCLLQKKTTEDPDIGPQHVEAGEPGEVPRTRCRDGSRTRGCGGRQQQQQQPSADPEMQRFLDELPQAPEDVRRQLQEEQDALDEATKRMQELLGNPSQAPEEEPEVAPNLLNDLLDQSRTTPTLRPGADEQSGEPEIEVNELDELFRAAREAAFTQGLGWAEAERMVDAYMSGVTPDENPEAWIQRARDLVAITNETRVGDAPRFELDPAQFVESEEMRQAMLTAIARAIFESSPLPASDSRQH